MGFAIRNDANLVVMKKTCLFVGKSLRYNERPTCLSQDDSYVAQRTKILFFLKERFDGSSQIC